MYCASCANMIRLWGMKPQLKIQTTRDAVRFSLPYIKGKVLDAGGGTRAKYRSLILSNASEYVNLDGQPGGFTDVVGDVMKMPFDGSSFDTVVCNQVLEHIPRPADVIAEASRVLKPGGYFVCTAPFLEPNHADPGDYFRYTQQGLESLCEASDFSIVHTQSYGGVFLVLYSFIRFKWFNPYTKLSRTSKSISRILNSLFSFLDAYIHPGIIYSDVLIIAQKK
jgi:SAM-dependent methyltransferase